MIEPWVECSEWQVLRSLHELNSTVHTLVGSKGTVTLELLDLVFSLGNFPLTSLPEDEMHWTHT